MKNKIEIVPQNRIPYILRSTLWFLVGFIFAGISLGSIVLIYFQYTYRDKVIPGVFVDARYVGDKRKEALQNFFNRQNEEIGKNILSLSYNGIGATISAKMLGIGYDTNLIAIQASSLGKSPDIISNLYIVVNSYINGTFLKSSYTFDTEKLRKAIDSIEKAVRIDPVDALFTVQNNRVIAFKESTDGKEVDFEELKQRVQEKIPQMINSKSPQKLSIDIPVKILKPTVTTEKANKFGIAEVISTGTSFFAHSIPNRIHNIVLAANRVNGVLVAPGEEFSFNKYLGDVSRYTGYKEAYIIQNGRTVLGDGGGVCQVSTTLFRAILNAGLPITERHAHAYRVGYYEQGFPPGLDATVYSPTVDLKFKNDTPNYILVQDTVNLNNLQLTFTLYGKKDSRETTLTPPVITSQIPPPAPVYQDDPTLPKGTIKQVDFEAWGANVSYKRIVRKRGKVIVDETYNSRYAPWKAVFLKGIKEG